MLRIFPEKCRLMMSYFGLESVLVQPWGKVVQLDEMQ